MKRLLKLFYIGALTIHLERSWYIKERIYISTLGKDSIIDFRLKSLELEFPEGNKIKSIKGRFLKLDESSIEISYDFAEFNEYLKVERPWSLLKYNFRNRISNNHISYEVLLRICLNNPKPIIENTSLEIKLNFLLYKVHNEFKVFKKKEKKFTDLIEYAKCQDFNFYNYFDTLEELEAYLVIFNKYPLAKILKEIQKVYIELNIQHEFEGKSVEDLYNKILNIKEAKLTLMDDLCDMARNTLNILESFNMNENSKITRLFMDHDLSSASICKCLIIKMFDNGNYTDLNVDLDLKCQSMFEKPPTVMKNDNGLIIVLLETKKYEDATKLIVKVSSEGKIIKKRAFALN